MRTHLGKRGRPEDIDELNELLKSESQRIRNAASHSTIQILSRVSIDKALQRATAPDIEELSDFLVRNLFERVAVVKTDTLKACLSSPSRVLRHMATRTLVARGALTTSEVQSICRDPSPTVSIMGFIAARKSQVKVDQDLVSKTIGSIDENEVNTPICWHTYQTDPTSKSQLNLCIAEYLSNLEMSELLTAEREDNWIATIVRCKIGKRSSKPELIEIVRKRSSPINARLNLFPSPSLGGLLGLNKYMTNSETNFALCQSAINTLCSFNSKSDLDDIRNLIKNPNIRISKDILKYFGKHGSWEDISLLEEKSQNISTWGVSLALQLGISKNSDRELARTYYKIGHDRIGDLLSGYMRVSMIPYLIANIPINKFSDIHNETIENFLAHKDGDVRVSCTLQVVRSMSASQIKAITEKYSQRSQPIYYDVCQWLDLGCSFSRKISKKCADDELAKRYL